MGNYWDYYELWYIDKYEEDPKDEDNDGIWDEPFVIDSFLSLRYDIYLNADRFPLVEPVDTENITVINNFKDSTDYYGRPMIINLIFSKILRNNPQLFSILGRLFANGFMESIHGRL